MNFGVKLYLGENPRISQRTKKLTFQHWLEINPAAGTIVEPDLQRIRINLLERLHSMNRSHTSTLLQRGNRCRSSALPEQFPVRQQFFLVPFRPSLHQPPLPLGNRPGQLLNSPDRKDRRVVLIVSMKVRYVVPFRRLDKHPKIMP